MGERIRFQLVQRTRPVRSALRVLMLLTVIYYFLPTIWFAPTYRHDADFESHLRSTRKPQIQHAFPSNAGADEARLQAVKDEFLHAYHGYKQRAWLKDEVKPISGGTHTQYCGWAATLIDSLDTLYIMGLYSEFDEAVTAVLSMSFAVAPSIGCSINPFEMTIRHLGGLIAAYDVSGATDERLLKKAVQMGEMLFQSYAKNRIQCRTILWPRFPGFPCDPNKSLSLARLGSQSLELVRYALNLSTAPSWTNNFLDYHSFPVTRNSSIKLDFSHERWSASRRRRTCRVFGPSSWTARALMDCARSLGSIKCIRWGLLRIQHMSIS